ncbi:MAG: flagellar basal body rod C-terminal domain-containing protein [Acidimicrobiales bacterium]|jgi:flagellar basal-body rod protein FlgC
MGLFDPISTAMSGVDASETWLNAISDNIANMNDVTSTSQAAYQERFVVMQAVPGQSGGTGSGAASDATIGSGVAVAGVALGSPEGVEEYDPGNPLADKNGMVRAADVDLGQQMTNMMLAQRGYEANLATISQAENAYQAALGLKV